MSGDYEQTYEDDFAEAPTDELQPPVQRHIYDSFDAQYLVEESNEATLAELAPIAASAEQQELAEAAAEEEADTGEPASAAEVAADPDAEAHAAATKIQAAFRGNAVRSKRRKHKKKVKKPQKVDDSHPAESSSATIETVSEAPPKPILTVSVSDTDEGTAGMQVLSEADVHRAATRIQSLFRGSRVRRQKKKNKKKKQQKENADHDHNSTPSSSAAQVLTIADNNSRPTTANSISSKKKKKPAKTSSMFSPTAGGGPSFTSPSSSSNSSSLTSPSSRAQSRIMKGTASSNSKKKGSDMHSPASASATSSRGEELTPSQQGRRLVLKPPLPSAAVSKSRRASLALLSPSNSFQQAQSPQNRAAAGAHFASGLRSPIHISSSSRKGTPPNRSVRGSTRASAAASPSGMHARSKRGSFSNAGNTASSAQVQPSQLQMFLPDSMAIANAPLLPFSFFRLIVRVQTRFRRLKLKAQLKLRQKLIQSRKQQEQAMIEKLAKGRPTRNRKQREPSKEDLSHHAQPIKPSHSNSTHSTSSSGASAAPAAGSRKKAPHHNSKRSNASSTTITTTTKPPLSQELAAIRIQSLHRGRSIRKKYGRPTATKLYISPPRSDKSSSSSLPSSPKDDLESPPPPFEGTPEEIQAAIAIQSVVRGRYARLASLPVREAAKKGQTVSPLAQIKFLSEHFADRSLLLQNGKLVAIQDKTVSVMETDTDLTLIPIRGPGMLISLQSVQSLAWKGAKTRARLDESSFKTAKLLATHTVPQLAAQHFVAMCCGVIMLLADHRTIEQWIWTLPRTFARRIQILPIDADLINEQERQAAAVKIQSILKGYNVRKTSVIRYDRRRAGNVGLHPYANRGNELEENPEEAQAVPEPIVRTADMVFDEMVQMLEARDSQVSLYAKIEEFLAFLAESNTAVSAYAKQVDICASIAPFVNDVITIASITHDAEMQLLTAAARQAIESPDQVEMQELVQHDEDDAAAEDIQDAAADDTAVAEDVQEEGGGAVAASSNPTDAYDEEAFEPDAAAGEEMAAELVPPEVAPAELSPNPEPEPASEEPLAEPAPEPVMIDMTFQSQQRGTLSAFGFFLSCLSYPHIPSQMAAANACAPYFESSEIFNDCSAISALITRYMHEEMLSLSDRAFDGLIRDACLAVLESVSRTRVSATILEPHLITMLSHLITAPVHVQLFITTIIKSLFQHAVVQGRVADVLLQPRLFQILVEYLNMNASPFANATSAAFNQANTPSYCPSQPLIAIGSVYELVSILATEANNSLQLMAQFVQSGLIRCVVGTLQVKPDAQSRNNSSGNAFVIHAKQDRATYAAIVFQCVSILSLLSSHALPKPECTRADVVKTLLELETRVRLGAFPRFQDHIRQAIFQSLFHLSQVDATSSAAHITLLQAGILTSIVQPLVQVLDQIASASSITNQEQLYDLQASVEESPINTINIPLYGLATLCNLAEQSIVGASNQLSQMLMKYSHSTDANGRKQPLVLLALQLSFGAISPALQVFDSLRPAARGLLLKVAQIAGPALLKEWDGISIATNNAAAGNNVTSNVASPFATQQNKAVALEEKEKFLIDLLLAQALPSFTTTHLTSIESAPVEVASSHNDVFSPPFAIDLPRLRSLPAGDQEHADALRTLLFLLMPQSSITNSPFDFALSSAYSIRYVLQTIKEHVTPEDLLALSSFDGLRPHLWALLLLLSRVRMPHIPTVPDSSWSSLLGGAPTSSANSTPMSSPQQDNRSNRFRAQMSLISSPDDESASMRVTLTAAQFHLFLDESMISNAGKLLLVAESGSRSFAMLDLLVECCGLLQLYMEHAEEAKLDKTREKGEEARVNKVIESAQRSLSALLDPLFVALEALTTVDSSSDSECTESGAFTVSSNAHQLEQGLFLLSTLLSSDSRARLACANRLPSLLERFHALFARHSPTPRMLIDLSAALSSFASAASSNNEQVRAALISDPLIEAVMSWGFGAALRKWGLHLQASSTSGGSDQETAFLQLEAFVQRQLLSVLEHLCNSDVPASVLNSHRLPQRLLRMLRSNAAAIVEEEDRLYAEETEIHIVPFTPSVGGNSTSTVAEELSSAQSAVRILALNCLGSLARTPGVLLLQDVKTAQHASAVDDAQTYDDSQTLNTPAALFHFLADMLSFNFHTYQHVAERLSSTPQPTPSPTLAHRTMAPPAAFSFATSASVGASPAQKGAAHSLAVHKNMLEQELGAIFFALQHVFSRFLPPPDATPTSAGKHHRGESQELSEQLFGGAADAQMNLIQFVHGICQPLRPVVANPHPGGTPAASPSTVPPTPMAPPTPSHSPYLFSPTGKRSSGGLSAIAGVQQDSIPFVHIQIQALEILNRLASFIRHEDGDGSATTSSPTMSQALLTTFCSDEVVELLLPHLKLKFLKLNAETANLRAVQLRMRRNLVSLLRNLSIHPQWMRQVFAASLPTTNSATVSRSESFSAGSPRDELTKGKSIPSLEQVDEYEDDQDHVVSALQSDSAASTRRSANDAAPEAEAGDNSTNISIEITRSTPSPFPIRVSPPPSTGPVQNTANGLILVKNVVGIFENELSAYLKEQQNLHANSYAPPQPVLSASYETQKNQPVTASATSVDNNDDEDADGYSHLFRELSHVLSHIVLFESEVYVPVEGDDGISDSSSPANTRSPLSQLRSISTYTTPRENRPDLSRINSVAASSPAPAAPIGLLSYIKSLLPSLLSLLQNSADARLVRTILMTMCLFTRLEGGRGTQLLTDSYINISSGSVSKNSPAASAYYSSASAQIYPITLLARAWNNSKLHSDENLRYLIAETFSKSLLVASRNLLQTESAGVPSSSTAPSTAQSSISSNRFQMTSPPNTAGSNSALHSVSHVSNSLSVPSHVTDQIGLTQITAERREVLSKLIAIVGGQIGFEQILEHLMSNPDRSIQFHALYLWALFLHSSASLSGLVPLSLSDASNKDYPLLRVGVESAATVMSMDTTLFPRMWHWSVERGLRNEKRKTIDLDKVKIEDQVVHVPMLPLVLSLALRSEQPTGDTSATLPSQLKLLAWTVLCNLACFPSNHSAILFWIDNVEDKAPQTDASGAPVAASSWWSALNCMFQQPLESGDSFYSVQLVSVLLANLCAVPTSAERVAKEIDFAGIQRVLCEAAPNTARYDPIILHACLQVLHACAQLNQASAQRWLEQPDLLRSVLVLSESTSAEEAAEEVGTIDEGDEKKEVTVATSPVSEVDPRVTYLIARIIVQITQYSGVKNSAAMDSLFPYICFLILRLRAESESGTNADQTIEAAATAPLRNTSMNTAIISALASSLVQLLCEVEPVASENEDENEADHSYHVDQCASRWMLFLSLDSAEDTLFELLCSPDQATSLKAVTLINHLTALRDHPDVHELVEHIWREENLELMVESINHLSSASTSSLLTTPLMPIAILMHFAAQAFEHQCLVNEQIATEQREEAAAAAAAAAAAEDTDGMAAAAAASQIESVLPSYTEKLFSPSLVKLLLHWSLRMEDSKVLNAPSAASNATDQASATSLAESSWALAYPRDLIPPAATSSEADLCAWVSLLALASLRILCGSHAHLDVLLADTTMVSTFSTSFLSLLARVDMPSKKIMAMRASAAAIAQAQAQAQNGSRWTSRKILVLSCLLACSHRAPSLEEARQMLPLVVNQAEADRKGLHSLIETFAENGGLQLLLNCVSPPQVVRSTPLTSVLSTLLSQLSTRLLASWTHLPLIVSHLEHMCPPALIVGQRREITFTLDGNESASDSAPAPMLSGPIAMLREAVFAHRFHHAVQYLSSLAATEAPWSSRPPSAVNTGRELNSLSFAPQLAQHTRVLNFCEEVLQCDLPPTLQAIIVVKLSSANAIKVQMVAQQQQQREKAAAQAAAQAAIQAQALNTQATSSPQLAASSIVSRISSSTKVRYPATTMLDSRSLLFQLLESRTVPLLLRLAGNPDTHPHLILALNALFCPRMIGAHWPLFVVAAKEHVSHKKKKSSSSASHSGNAKNPDSIHYLYALLLAFFQHVSTLPEKCVLPLLQLWQLSVARVIEGGLRFEEQSASSAAMVHDNNRPIRAIQTSPTGEVLIGAEQHQSLLYTLHALLIGREHENLKYHISLQKEVHFCLLRSLVNLSSLPVFHPSIVLVKFPETLWALIQAQSDPAPSYSAGSSPDAPPSIYANAGPEHILAALQIIVNMYRDTDVLAGVASLKQGLTLPLVKKTLYHYFTLLNSPSYSAPLTSDGRGIAPPSSNHERETPTPAQTLALKRLVLEILLLVEGVVNVPVPLVRAATASASNNVTSPPSASKNPLKKTLEALKEQQPTSPDAQRKVVDPSRSMFACHTISLLLSCLPNMSQSDLPLLLSGVILKIVQQPSFEFVAFNSASEESTTAGNDSQQGLSTLPKLFLESARTLAKSEDKELAKHGFLMHAAFIYTAPQGSLQTLPEPLLIEVLEFLFHSLAQIDDEHHQPQQRKIISIATFDNNDQELNEAEELVLVLKCLEKLFDEVPASCVRLSLAKKETHLFKLLNLHRMRLPFTETAMDESETLLVPISKILQKFGPAVIASLSKTGKNDNTSNELSWRLSDLEQKLLPGYLWLIARWGSHAAQLSFELDVPEIIANAECKSRWEKELQRARGVQRIFIRDIVEMLESLAHRFEPLNKELKKFPVSDESEKKERPTVNVLLHVLTTLITEAWSLRFGPRLHHAGQVHNSGVSMITCYDILMSVLVPSDPKVDSFISGAGASDISFEARLLTLFTRLASNAAPDLVHQLVQLDFFDRVLRDHWWQQRSTPISGDLIQLMLIRLKADQLHQSLLAFSQRGFEAAESNQGPVPGIIQFTSHHLLHQPVPTQHHPLPPLRIAANNNRHPLPFPSYLYDEKVLQTLLLVCHSPASYPFEWRSAALQVLKLVAPISIVWSTSPHPSSSAAKQAKLRFQQSHSEAHPHQEYHFAHLHPEASKDVDVTGTDKKDASLAESIAVALQANTPFSVELLFELLKVWLVRLSDSNKQSSSSSTSSSSSAKSTPDLSLGDLREFIFGLKQLCAPLPSDSVNPGEVDSVKKIVFYLLSQHIEHWLMFTWERSLQLDLGANAIGLQQRQSLQKHVFQLMVFFSQHSQTFQTLLAQDRAALDAAAAAAQAATEEGSLPHARTTTTSSLNPFSPLPLSPAQQRARAESAKSKVHVLNPQFQANKSQDDSASGNEEKTNDSKEAAESKSSLASIPSELPTLPFLQSLLLYFHLPRASRLPLLASFTSELCESLRNPLLRAYLWKNEWSGFMNALLELRSEFFECNEEGLLIVEDGATAKFIVKVTDEIASTLNGPAEARAFLSSLLSSYYYLLSDMKLYVTLRRYLKQEVQSRDDSLDRQRKKYFAANFELRMENAVELPPLEDEEYQPHGMETYRLAIEMLQQVVENEPAILKFDESTTTAAASSSSSTESSSEKTHAQLIAEAADEMDSQHDAAEAGADVHSTEESVSSSSSSKPATSSTFTSKLTRENIASLGALIEKDCSAFVAQHSSNLAAHRRNAESELLAHRKRMRFLPLMTGYNVPAVTLASSLLSSTTGPRDWK